MRPRRAGPAAAITLAVALLTAVALPAPPPIAAEPTADTQLAQSATEPCTATPRAYFRDVADGTTAAAAIDCLVFHELVRGVAYDRFGPAEPLTRGQVASLLDRLIAVVAAPLPDPATPVFSDVGRTHGPAVERLATAGIVTGRTAERYEPDMPVRRDQLAALLDRTDVFLGASAPTADAPAPQHAFMDIVGTTHEAAIARAALAGLVGGTTPTTYEPGRSATRAQTAMVLARALIRWEELPSIAADPVTPGGYHTRTSTLPSSLRADVDRFTWEPGCPVAPTDLRVVEVVFTDFSGVERWGPLLVHHGVASEVADAFGDLYRRGFRIARIEPVEWYRGDDDASMAANNTSAFNCRRVTGGTSFSQHSYGRAIDINPVQNPYVRSGTVLPPAGTAYLDRSDVRPGMLVRPGPVDAFDRIGWGWGGDFTSLKDYQHVSASGG